MALGLNINKPNLKQEPAEKALWWGQGRNWEK